MIFGEGPDMDDTPATEDRDPLNLRVLRILVTVLTVTMIVGLITVVAVFVTRFESGSPVALPDQVTLPEGETARAVTFKLSKTDTPEFTRWLRDNAEPELRRLYETWKAAQQRG